MPELTQKEKLHAFLRDAIDNAAGDSPLYGCQLRFTHFEFADEENYGICLGNVVSDTRPGPGGVMDEWDARLIVTTYARVTGIERDERLSAYAQSKAIALKVAELLWADNGLGGRTCNSWPGKLIDDYDQLSADQTHAVNNLYVVLNRSGANLPEPWS